MSNRSKRHKYEPQPEFNAYVDPLMPFKAMAITSLVLVIISIGCIIYLFLETFIYNVNSNSEINWDLIATKKLQLDDRIDKKEYVGMRSQTRQLVFDTYDTTLNPVLPLYVIELISNLDQRLNRNSAPSFSSISTSNVFITADTITTLSSVLNITSATNTINILGELFLAITMPFMASMNQHVTTTSSVTFAATTIDQLYLNNNAIITNSGNLELTGAGGNILFNGVTFPTSQFTRLAAIDQDLATSSGPTFNSLTVDGTSTTAFTVRKDAGGLIAFQVDTSTGNGRILMPQLTTDGSVVITGGVLSSISATPITSATAPMSIPGGNVTLTYDGTSLILSGGTTLTTAQDIRQTASPQFVELKVGYGLVTEPSYTFTSDETLGIYGAANLVGISVGGVAKATFETSSVTITQPLTVNGTNSTSNVNQFFNMTSTYISADLTGFANSQTLNFTGAGSTASGMDHRVVVGGAAAGLVENVYGAIVYNPLKTTTSTITATNVYSLYLAYDSTVGTTSPLVGSTNHWSIYAPDLKSYLYTLTTTLISNSDGTSTNPVYTFGSDTDTGMYRVTTNTLGFTTNQVLRLSVDTISLTSTLPIYAPIGLVTAPSYSFAGDTNTGIYSPIADTISFSAGGVQSAFINTLGLTVSIANDSTSTSTGALVVTGGVGIGGALFGNTATFSFIYTTSGSATFPSYSFSGDTNTGMYTGGADTVGFSTAGVSRALINTTSFTISLGTASTTTSTGALVVTGGVGIGGALYVGSTGNFTGKLTLGAASPALQISSYTTPGFLVNDSSGNITSTVSPAFTSLTLTTLYVGNILPISPAVTFELGTGALINSISAVGTPAYSFVGDGNTGMYSSGANTINFSTDGALRLTVDTTLLTSTLPITLPGGGQGTPSLMFGDTDTGFYGSGNNVYFTSIGTHRITFNEYGFTILQGSATNPSYSFLNDTNTGMYSSGTGIINFSTGGSNRLSISTATITLSLPILTSDAINNAIYSFYLSNTITGTGTLYGIRNNIIPNYISAGTHHAIGYDQTLDITSTVGISTATSIRIAPPTVSGTGTLTSAYGIYIPSEGASNAVENRFGIYIGAQGGGLTLNYDIYAEGTSYFGVAQSTTSYISGNAYIGSTTTPVVGTRLTIYGKPDGTTDDGSISIAGTSSLVTATYAKISFTSLSSTPTAQSGSMRFWTINAGTLTNWMTLNSTGQLTLSGGNTSISTSTGDLVVSGGVGIGGSLYATSCFFSSLSVGPGTSAAPSFTFTADNETGMYLIGGSILGFTVNQSGFMKLTETGLRIGPGSDATGNARSVLQVTGSIVGPQYDEAVAGNVWGFGTYDTSVTGKVVAGIVIENTLLGGSYSQKLALRTHSFGVGSGARLTIDEAGSIAFNTYTTPGFLVNDSSGNITSTVSPSFISLTLTTLYVGNILPISPASTFELGTGALINRVSAVGTPAYSFVGDGNTGMYSSAADTINFATAGTLALTIGSTQNITMAGVLTATGVVSRGPNYPTVQVGTSVSLNGYLIWDNVGNALGIQTASNIYPIKIDGSAFSVTSKSSLTNRVGLGSVNAATDNWVCLNVVGEGSTGSAVGTNRAIIISGTFANDFVTNTCGVNVAGTFLGTIGDDCSLFYANSTITGTYATVRGLFVENLGNCTGVTAKYGIWVSEQLGAATNYGAYFGSNVGIKTSTPTVELEVVGTIKTTNLTVTSSITSGYLLLGGPTTTISSFSLRLQSDDVWRGGIIAGAATGDCVVIGNFNNTTGALIGGHNSTANAWAPLTVGSNAELILNNGFSVKLTPVAVNSIIATNVNQHLVAVTIGSNLSFSSGTLNLVSDPAVSGTLTVAGSVGVGTLSPNASAALQIDSIDKGFCPPRMTKAQRLAISTPMAGLMVYDTTDNILCVYTTSWQQITTSAAPV